MSGHVDAESLALYAEGELSHRRTARVRAHLADCADCAATIAALTEVTVQFSHVPASPMPAAVAARLDAALSAESAHRAAAPAPAPAGAPAPRPPRRNPLWSPKALRLLAATGVTLVVAGGVGYALSQSSGPSPSGTSATAGSPSPSAQHRSPVEGAPNAPNVSPGSQAIHSKSAPGSSSRTVYVQTGTDYRPDTLAAQATQAKHNLREHTLAPGNVPGWVKDCVNQTAHNRSVLLVDLARYQHQPAIVIVLGQPETVVVVSDSCAPLHSARLAGGG